jgi:xanthine dehydrogenase accessory factor
MINDELISKINELKESGEDFVLITLVNARGSAPQVVGAKMLVSAQGLKWGTVGGGKLEKTAIEKAQKMLTQKVISEFVEWNLQTDIGMTCGGVVSLYLEKFYVSNSSKGIWSIAVFGAGHVAQELVPLLLKLDCQVFWIDSRREWLDKIASNSRLVKIETENLASALESLPENTFIASMTMGHAFDLPILKDAFLKHSFPYVGVIGSESKSRVLKNDLLSAGVDKILLEQLHCPIGEDFGNNTPVEIAFSIVAQLLKLRS